MNKEQPDLYKWFLRDMEQAEAQADWAENEARYFWRQAELSPCACALCGKSPAKCFEGLVPEALCQDCFVGVVAEHFLQPKCRSELSVPESAKRWFYRRHGYE